MDYEKKYKEAIEKVRSLHDNADEVSKLIDLKEELENIFPELAESEDERIREEIISMSETLGRKNWIAWLEKQGEQKDKLEDAVLDSNKDGLIADTIRCKIEKQGELKPTDKVEPKFKIGDTVTVKPMSCHGKVFKGEPFKIVDIIEDNYVSDDGKTYSISLQDGWKLVEQNPAWSEEDESMLKRAVDFIRPSDDCTSDYAVYKREIIFWLESLKERYTWKPSEEQMVALNSAITAASDNLVCLNVKDLESLYEQLKKLREK